MTITDVLAVIAIVISIGTAAIGYYYDKKINNINIDIQYYDKVYSEYLLERIPECRMRIERKADGSLLGVDEFIRLLREMRRNSLYFKFANEEFYNEFRRLNQQLEDTLIMAPDNINTDGYRSFRCKMDETIYQIYECIHKASHGRKYKK